MHHTIYYKCFHMDRYIIFIIVLFLFSQCGKHASQAPSFDNRLLAWIPYDVDDEIEFINKNGETLTFEITDKIIKESRFDPAAGPGENSAMLKARLKTKSIFKSKEFMYDYLVFISQPLSGKYSGRVTYNLFDYATVFESYPLSLAKYKQKGQKKRILDSLAIRNKVLTNVIELLRDTSTTYLDNDKCTVYKMYIAEGYGIVGFSDRISNNDWFLKDVACFEN